MPRLVEDRAQNGARRVVVTGLGLVTPLGTGVEKNWTALMAGRSGIGPVTRFDTSDFPTRIAGEVRDFAPETYIEKREIKKMDPFIQYAVGAAQMAMDQSGLKIPPADADRVGVIVGVGMGGLQSIEQFHTLYLESRLRKVSPFFVAKVIANLAPGQISIRFGARGVNYTPTSACASGATAIGEAFRNIRHGYQDAVIAGGTEAALCGLGLGGFIAMRAVSTRNDEPERASRPFDRNRDGFVVAEGAGILVLEALDHAQARGARILGEVIGNLAPGQIAIHLGAKGVNFTPTSACASGATAVGEAFRNIRHGYQDAVIAGGAEAPLCGLGIGGFIAMRALSTRNDAPERASRPFDRGRDGFVMAEGAGVVVLEALEHAQARGATILAELVGYGANEDAFHITAPAPGGEGAMRCMRQTLADAGLAPEDVDYINAHGTGTPANDPTETRAIRQTFGERANALAVSSTKSMHGHALGAAGAIELVATIGALRDGVVPPTANFVDPDPACDLDYVPNVARDLRVRAALSNSFAFGGLNAVIALRRAP
jgi:3-oxoacyl-[acyl-carrier-protein] synthase II